MSFHLRLWDFDIDAALNSSAEESHGEGRGENMPRGGRISDEVEIEYFRLSKEVLGNVSSNFIAEPSFHGSSFIETRN